MADPRSLDADPNATGGGITPPSARPPDPAALFLKPGLRRGAYAEHRDLKPFLAGLVLEIHTSKDRSENYTAAVEAPALAGLARDADIPFDLRCPGDEAGFLFNLQALPQDRHVVA